MIVGRAITLAQSKYYSEKLRPQIHFSPPEHWMNDPNGLVYYKDEYHLFYQHNPVENRWGNIHWGHAVSKDLIHWKHLDIALYPDQFGLMFSGCAVVDKDDTSGFFNGKEGLVVIYTTALPQKSKDFYLQQQCIAYSKDKGRTWHKYEDNPVIENDTQRDFRDPKVIWHQKTESWIMVVTNGKKVSFYRSSDLKKWEFTSDFSCNAFDFEGVWECPDLIKLPVENEDNKRWLLEVGIQDNSCAGGSGVQYFVGEFDGYKFKNINPNDKTFWADHGQDFYAVQSWYNLPEEQNREVWIAWMSNLSYCEAVPTNDWRGVLSLPRELKLIKINNEYFLKQKPIKEINKLRVKEDNIAEHDLTDDFNYKLDFDPFEIEFEVQLDSKDKLNIYLIRGNNLKIHLIYDRKNKEVFLKRSFGIDKKIGHVFNSTHIADIYNKKSKVEIKVILDRSTLEVFINQGEIVFSELIFPEGDDNTIFSLSTESNNAKIYNMNINKLKGVWS